jgi:prepilin peptidase CpaA
MKPLAIPSGVGAGALANTGGADSSLLSLLVLTAVLMVAVYVELKESRIPNWLTISGMSLGLLINYLRGNPAFWSSLGGLVIGFGFLFIFYIFGGIGGGDVKLMGAAGALMGSELIKPALIYTAFLGAAMAILVVVWRKDFWTRLQLALRRLAFWRKAVEEPSAPAAPVTVPYGVAIAAGCVMALIVKGMG